MFENTSAGCRRRELVAALKKADVFARVHSVGMICFTIHAAVPRLHRRAPARGILPCFSLRSDELNSASRAQFGILYREQVLPLKINSKDDLVARVFVYSRRARSV